MRTLFTALVAVVLCLPAFADQQECCDRPQDVMAAISMAYPSSYLVSDQEFANSDGVTHYVMVFRAEGVPTDLAVFFDGAPGSWCAVSSMEMLKPDAEA